MGRHVFEGSRSTRALDMRLLRFQNLSGIEEPSMLTRDLLAAGRLDDARAVFEQALYAEPDDADLLLTGGELFLERGDFAWAQRLLVRAAARDEGWASPWLALARLLLATHDLRRAEAVLERCWELAPGAPETWALDERYTASSALERRMAAFFEDPHADDPAMLANALLAADRDDDALSVLDLGLATFPDDIDSLFVRARLHETRGQLLAARADLARATGNDQSWATAWEALEDVCRQSGDHAAARYAETHAQTVRDRNAALAELDRSFLVGAAEMLVNDLTACATLADDAPHFSMSLDSGSVPVGGEPSPSQALAQKSAVPTGSPDARCWGSFDTEETVAASGFAPVSSHQPSTALESTSGRDLDVRFPTYSRILASLDVDPAGSEAMDASGPIPRAPLALDRALDSFLDGPSTREDLASEPEALEPVGTRRPPQPVRASQPATPGRTTGETGVDTLVGHRAPAPPVSSVGQPGARGLRLARRGRQPYVPPRPHELVPRVPEARVFGSSRTRR